MRRTRPYRRKNMSSGIGDFVPDLMAEIYGPARARLLNLITHWPGIIGANYAARTQPVKISEQHKKGVKKFDQNTIKATLHMRVEGPILLDLTHSQSQILARVNQFFGYQAITDLRFQQKPVLRPQKALRPATWLQLPHHEFTKPIDEKLAIGEKLATIVQERQYFWQQAIGEDHSHIFPTARFIVASDSAKKWDVFATTAWQNLPQKPPPTRQSPQPSQPRDFEKELAPYGQEIFAKLASACGQHNINALYFNLDYFGQRHVFGPYSEIPV